MPPTTWKFPARTAGQPGAHLRFFTVPGLRARRQAELDAAVETRRQEERLRQLWTFIQPLIR